MSNAWKITIPVSRAEEREDGLYLVGEASGPERDTHGTEMAPEAIVDFARQIKERVEMGDPLPYIDNHLKMGVMRELGNVMEGEVDRNFHLRIVVRLNERNPAAKYLYESIKFDGKQYGMSIGGDGVQFEIVKDESGSKFIRFIKVLLREISATTKPSWVPSFGTVLARSLDGDITSENDNMPDLDQAAPVEETTAAAEPVPAEVVNSAEEQETTEQAEEAVERLEETADEPVAEEATEEPVERARIAKKDADALLAAYNAMGEQLKALGVLAAEETAQAPAPENTTVENSEKGEEDLVEIGGVRLERSIAEAVTSLVTAEVERATASLAKTVAEQQEYITQLENMPAGKVPAPIVREKFEKVNPDFSKMTPEERLRWGLSGIYNRD